MAEEPDKNRLRCTKCGGQDCSVQDVDGAWGKDWKVDYDSWVATYLSPDLTNGAEGAEDASAAR